MIIYLHYDIKCDLSIVLFADDKIKIEDLTLYEPFFISNIQKSKCSICNEFANIHCVNCKDCIWLCVDHWEYHKADYHKL